MNFFKKSSDDSSKKGPKVLSVGQCGFDHGTISRVFKDQLGAEVVGASSFAKAADALATGDYDLVLMNRILDSDGSSGIELIRRLKADPSTAETRVMLVSNYPDAQKEAEDLGALPGFGKSSLRSDEVLQRLKAILQPSE